NLERAANQQQGEMDHLLEQLRGLKLQAESDKEALKRATRAQKHRAERSEDTAGQLSAQLLDMENQMVEALSAAENWRGRHAQEMKDKAQLEMEVSVLNRFSRPDIGSLYCIITWICGQIILDTHTVLYCRLTGICSPLSGHVVCSGGEAGSVPVREREARQVRDQLESEVEVVRRELLGRLTELEPLPEALRRSEVLLEEAQDREHAQERCNTELSTTLADLRMKVEQQGSQVELVRQKNSVLLEENKQLQHRVESLERKLEEATCQNRDLVGVITKREETIHGNQLRLEEKSRECMHLTRQLEEALDDARRQLSRTATELTTLRRSKEEAERRYQSRLQDVKDRLEQSDSTNRSLQNYVQFLKASYAN
ncbi:unnamed protein product, partial [Coregonus sp. 'balchen']